MRCPRWSMRTPERWRRGTGFAVSGDLAQLRAGTLGWVRDNAGYLDSPSGRAELPVVPRAKAAEVLAMAQEMDFKEHSMYAYIEKLKSIEEAVKKFGRL